MYTHTPTMPAQADRLVDRRKPHGGHPWSILDSTNNRITVRGPVCGMQGKFFFMSPLYFRLKHWFAQPKQLDRRILNDKIAEQYQFAD